VPGTCNLAVLQLSVAERTPLMGTLTVEGVESSIHAKEGDLTIPDLKLAAGPIRNLGDGTKCDGT
jgi:hypothetical protein